MKSMATAATMLALGFALHGAPARAQAPVQPAAAPAEQLLTTEQLDQLVAPIALYPDTLLAEVLMASTYPLEVVEADRWATANKKLKGDQLKAAANKQKWDDSLKALVATPSVLSMMSTKLDWTQKLGDAVLAQQPDVMDAIQRLRAKAHAQNKLTTTKQQKVSVTQQENKQVVVIEPAQPDMIYVPYYNPSVVYGEWPYPTYPPYYFPPPAGYVAGAAIATGLAFGTGYAVGRWVSGGNYWGGGVNWGNRSINVNRPINVNNAVVNNWTHNSVHRRGVAYNNASVQQRFGNNNIRAGNQARLDFRGRGGEQVLRPGTGGGRPNLDGGRPTAGGDRARPGADRPNVANRGDGGARASAASRAKADRPNVADRGKPGGDRNRSGGAKRPQRDGAFNNINSGKVANLQANRGRESLGSHPGGGARISAGGGRPGGAGAGGFRGAGGGFRGGGGGRRR
jgi:hypothetical protein